MTVPSVDLITAVAFMITAYCLGLFLGARMMNDKWRDAIEKAKPK